MRVLSIELANFRNYAAIEFEPPAGTSILIGANAQGKSNLLEALALLATGKSFRASREADMVRSQAPAANVSARVQTRHGEVRAACIITAVGEGSRKRFFRSGRAVPYGQFLGGIAAVTFTPFDLALVGGPAALRRRMLNAALAQSGRGYYRDLAHYAKVLAQKNALLRFSAGADRTLLDTYNDQLCDCGVRVSAARAAYVRRLAVETASVHARWIRGHQVLHVEYRPSPAQDDESPPAMANVLRAALDKAMPAEIARKIALVGPHRDDFALLLDAQPLARFGSQGQQRTAILALKSAEYFLLHASAGEAPLLLLDDVLSELDGARRMAFLETLGDYDQAFITATELPELPAALRPAVIGVEDGRLTPLSAVHSS
ncbi:MAG: DNA replication and repair protein RecF [Candidatus Eremiobacteraeota bacterium]|nr:DNA replication and repair protein RecF [Candidatus Eremiobacteraeota bacterium]